VDVVLLEEWSNHVTSGVEVAGPSGRVRFRWVTYAGVVKVSMAVGSLQEDSKTGSAPDLLHLKASDDKFAVPLRRKDQRTTNSQRYKTNE
jgi:hypothetical protein